MFNEQQSMKIMTKRNQKKKQNLAAFMKKRTQTEETRAQAALLQAQTNRDMMQYFFNSNRREG